MNEPPNIQKRNVEAYLKDQDVTQFETYGHSIGNGMMKHRHRTNNILEIRVLRGDVDLISSLQNTFFHFLIEWEKSQLGVWQFHSFVNARYLEGFVNTRAEISHLYSMIFTFEDMELIRLNTIHNHPLHKRAQERMILLGE